MSVHVTRQPSHPHESPASDSRHLGRRALLTAILVGALIAAGTALGTERSHTAYLWVSQTDDSSADSDANADSDGDGLSARVERSGITTATGDKYVTDPDVADSDSDGLTDGEEAGALITNSDTALVYRGISDPGLKDSDDDGVGDGDEYFLGTDPWSDDTDDDGLQDDEELDYGSDPLIDNPDRDAHSDREERERGSAPMTYDKTGWRAKLSTALTILKAAISGADKLSGGGKLNMATKAMKAAKAAGVATPMIWDALRSWDMSEIDVDELLGEVFGDDMDKLGETLEGGRSSYVAYVGRTPEGNLAYVGITDDFTELTTNHGGLNALSVVGGPDPLPLGQARAIAEAVLAGAYDRLDLDDLRNARHVIDPADNLYAPASKWGSEQLERTAFEW